ncbi:MAG TPA: efflux RND transporter periplasmic adaptor subunit [Candidatus Angelobacter sp.]|nr:efflux RND transporter periplasmic adaptor subunit [Candidatus Angelobacter sp.]
MAKGSSTEFPATSWKIVIGMALAALLSLAPFLSLTGCTNAAKGGPPNPGPPIVQVTEVEKKDVPIVSEWIATLDGYVNAQIQPHVTGYLIKQNYKEGSLVKKGDVLFEIDPRTFVAALDQAKAQLEQAKAQLGKAELDVRRDTPLAEAKAIAQSQLDNDIQAQMGAKALVAAGQANVEQAQLNLDFTKVTSLVTGIAGVAQVQIGNLVGPNSVLTSVSQVDPIKTYFTVSEQEYLDFNRRFPTESSREAEVRRAQLELILADGTKYAQKGTISFADREVNPSTGAIRIAGVFANPGNILRPGEYGRVRTSTITRKDALLVPQRAVSELQGSYQVAVVSSDNKVSIRPVKVGERVGPMWIIDEGLKPDERVIVEGVQKVKEGSPVNPQTWDASKEHS